MNTVLGLKFTPLHVQRKLNFRLYCIFYVSIVKNKITVFAKFKNMQTHKKNAMTLNYISLIYYADYYILTEF